jgi:hypothetical protein
MNPAAEFPPARSPDFFRTSARRPWPLSRHRAGPPGGRLDAPVDFCKRMKKYLGVKPVVLRRNSAWIVFRFFCLSLKPDRAMYWHGCCRS